MSPVAWPLRCVPLVGLFVINLAAPPVGAPTQSGHAVYGVGNSSCGTWSTARRDETSRSPVAGFKRDLFTTWIQGYLTASGAYADGDLRRVDADAVKVWVDRYCDSHPVETLNEASRALVAMLSR